MDERSSAWSAARSELERRFAHYLRAVILRTPRVAAAVTATAAATSSDEIGSTTFGRATKRKWATGWGGVGTREI